MPQEIHFSNEGDSHQQKMKEIRKTNYTGTYQREKANKIVQNVENAIKNSDPSETIKAIKEAKREIIGEISRKVNIEVREEEKKPKEYKLLKGKRGEAYGLLEQWQESIMEGDQDKIDESWMPIKIEARYNEILRDALDHIEKKMSAPRSSQVIEQSPSMEEMLVDESRSADTNRLYSEDPWYKASPSSQVHILLNCLRDMDKGESLDISMFNDINTDIVRNTLRLREAVAGQDETVGPGSKWPKDTLRQFAFLAARNVSLPSNTREFMNKNDMGFTASEFQYVKDIAKRLHSEGNVNELTWPKGSMITYIRNFTSNSLSKHAKRKEDYNKAMEDAKELPDERKIDVSRKDLDNSVDKNLMEKQWEYFNKKNKKGEFDNEIANLRSALTSFKTLKKQNKEKTEEIEAYNCQVWLQLINPTIGARKPKIPEGTSQGITNTEDAKEALYNLLKFSKTEKSYNDTEINFESALNKFKEKAQEESFK